MAALEVVVGEEAVGIGLNLVDALVSGGPPSDAEALLDEGPVHPLDEAVGLGRAHLRRAVLDVLEGEQQLVGMLLRPAAELQAVVGQDSAHGHAQSLVEGQDAIPEEIAGGDGHLRVVDLGEGERAEGVDHDLDLDLADALERAPVEGVLVEEVAGAGHPGATALLE